MSTVFAHKSMTDDELNNLIGVLQNQTTAPDPRISSLFGDPYSLGTQTASSSGVNPPQTLTQPSPASGASSPGAAMARAASQTSYASLLGWPTGDDDQSYGIDPVSGQPTWGAQDYNTPSTMNPTSTNFGQGADNDGMLGIQMRTTVLPVSVQAKFGMQPAPSTPANVQAPVNQASDPSQSALPGSNQAYGINPATGQPWWGAPPDNVPDYFKLMPSPAGTGSDDGMQGIQMRTTTLPVSVQAKFGLGASGVGQPGAFGAMAAPVDTGSSENGPFPRDGSTLTRNAQYKGAPPSIQLASSRSNAATSPHISASGVPLGPTRDHHDLKGNLAAAKAGILGEPSQIPDGWAEAADPPQEGGTFVFNGTTLKWFNPDHKLIGSWPAYSGAAGSNAKDQMRPSFGPIPEGRYSMDPTKTMYWTDSQISDRLSHNNYSADPANPVNYEDEYEGWGDRKVQITPQPGTAMGSRNPNGFWLHGGRYMGSVGCIDIGPNELPVIEELRQLHQPVNLVVDYSQWKGFVPGDRRRNTKVQWPGWTRRK